MTGIDNRPYGNPMNNNGYPMNNNGYPMNNNGYPKYPQNGYFPPNPMNAPIKRPRGKRIGLLMFLVVMIYIGMSVIAEFALGQNPEPLESIIISSAAVTILSILVPSVIYIYVGRKPHECYNFNKMRGNQILPCILIAVGLCFAALIFSNIFSELYSMAGVDFSKLDSPMPDLHTPIGLIVTVICVCVGPAVCEELLCRSAILYSMRSLGLHAAALWSGLYFALLHTNFISLPIYIALGYIFGVMAYKTRSVYSTMLVHFVYNFTLIMLEFIGSGVEDASASATLGINTAYFWIVMGIFAVIAAVFLIPGVILFVKNCKKNDIAEAESKGITVRALLDGYNMRGESVNLGKGFMIPSLIILAVVTCNSMLLML